jgi:putative heme-binding domain-containing protein
MTRRQRLAARLAAAIGVFVGLGSTAATAQEPDREVIPHGQSRPPGQPLSPEEAIRKMTVPDGFRVEVVASEPDIVNPVAMTFDERGRVWLTESLEYPRRAPGTGRDRVKVLEDTDGDGRADKFTVFAEGLNIPSGIAVGHGGVWVANAPDVLFMQDTDGDGKADRREVVVTGFGRFDTHELPNSLSWGPDGWLYGWNGVFNPSHVGYRGKTYDFTCAVFRIHPKTRAFELFCEGTSNPWGIAWDREGSAFASACVVDHLWHLTESGYYHRQGGPYPPFTWKLGSIVNHTHQKAAYCGIHFYDSDAYPPAYRGKLFMGNIHGNCVNVDALQRNGSTYRATAEPDFLSANDAWFMPVSVKTGPDGCLYVLDWYDRYHCYQDANRDPAGIDRLKGRLYRVCYKDAPRRGAFDLAKKTDDQLIGLLGSSNTYDRETARRLLVERGNSPSVRRLKALALDAKAPRPVRMDAVWALVSLGPLEPGLQDALLSDPDAGFRAWGVRASGNMRLVAPAVREKVVALARDPSPDVQLQVAIAARKVEGVDAMAVLMDVASACGDDPLIPHIVWQNLYPLLGNEGGRLFSTLKGRDDRPSPALSQILPRALEFALAQRRLDEPLVGAIFRRIISSRETAPTRQAIDALAARFRDRSLSVESRDRLRDEIIEPLGPEWRRRPEGPLTSEFMILSAYWRDANGLSAARAFLLDRGRPEPLRLKALEALASSLPPEHVPPIARQVLDDTGSGGSTDFRGRVLGALGSVDSPKVAELVLDSYPRMEPELRPRAIELLTQRPAWSLALLKAVGEGKISADALNLNQVRKLLASHDPEVVRQVKARWGTVREGRSPQREQLIDRMRALLRTTEGDPRAGAEVFKRVCAQCHRIYGEGQEVGPEITLNGRGSFEQLLSNVFDPSLVIGASYQSTTVATADGRVLTGLLAEDSPQRVVLKSQGGKLESVPRAEVDELKVSPLSLMPEDLEKQLKPQELADLFAFITLDRPPGDPRARPIPGAEGLKRRREPR